METVCNLIHSGGQLRSAGVAVTVGCARARGILLCLLLLFAHPVIADSKIIVSPASSSAQNARILDRFSAQLQLEFGFDAVDLIGPLPVGFNSRQQMGLNDVPLLEYGA
ncbi:MAG: hypothetical protein ACPH3H_08625, partial [Pseudomonadales bacterium]